MKPLQRNGGKEELGSQGAKKQENEGEKEQEMSF